MSIRIMAACWDVPGLKASHKLTLLALADHADDHGRCWPRVERIAAMVDVDRRTVQRALRALEEAGVLTTTPGGGRKRSSRYRIVPGALPIPGQFAALSERKGRQEGPETAASAPPESSGTVTTDTSIEVSAGGAWYDGVRCPRGWSPLELPWTWSAPTGGRHDVPRKVGRIDQLWDALVDVCGIDRDSITKTARGRLNAALRDLRDVGATPGDVRTRGRRYRALMPGAQLTPTGLVANWPRLSDVRPSSPPADRCPPHPAMDMEDERGRWCPACKTWEADWPPDSKEEDDVR